MDLFQLKNKKALHIFLIFSLLSILLRFFSFFPSVIDHDESTYLEIARMLLNGKILYVDMVDIKPPGIFLILAGFETVFGYSIFFIRLLVSLWIAFTAFMVYKTAWLLLKNDRASIAAGIIYIFMISSWSFYGLSITPEIFFNLFTISALYLLLKKQSRLNFVLAGLLAGLGFIVKYLVLFDFASIMVFMIILHFTSKENPKFYTLFINLFLAGIAFFLPFGLTNLYYYLNGHFAEFYNIVYLAPARYPSPFNAQRMFKFILDFHLLYLPVFFFFYYALIDRKISRSEISLTKEFLILWTLMAGIAVILAGRKYGHYMIELMLPVSLAAGLFFHSDRPLPGILDRIINRRSGQLILAGLILLITLLKLEYVIKRDVPREVAAYLEPKLKPGDVIYTANYHHILYYLLKKDSPTKYIHRTLLLGNSHIKALDIDADKEFREIIARRPEYIITENKYPAGIMKDYIDSNYTVEKDFGDRIILYRLSNK